MNALHRRICCTCKTTIGLLIEPTMHGDTHGFCKPCAAAWRAQYLEWKEQGKEHSHA